MSIRLGSMLITPRNLTQAADLRYLFVVSIQALP